jgi:hypothetical protein
MDKHTRYKDEAEGFKVQEPAYKEQASSNKQPVTSNKIKGPLKHAEPGLVGAHERK